VVQPQAVGFRGTSRVASTYYADRLTMRISRCRVRGNGDEAGRGAAKYAAVPPARRRTGSSALDEPVVARAVLLTRADLGHAEGPALSGRDDACGVVDTLAMADEALAGGEVPTLLLFVRR
jgi:hypothetical protein